MGNALGFKSGNLHDQRGAKERHPGIKIKQGLEKAKIRSSKTIYGATIIVQVTDCGSRNRRKDKAKRIIQYLAK